MQVIVPFVWFGNTFGYFFQNLGDFFSNPSGHPDYNSLDRFSFFFIFLFEFVFFSLLSFCLNFKRDVQSCHSLPLHIFLKLGIIYDFPQIS
jgi:hypothetical protein